VEHYRHVLMLCYKYNDNLINTHSLYLLFYRCFSRTHSFFFSFVSFFSIYMSISLCLAYHIMNERYVYIFLFSIRLFPSVLHIISYHDWALWSYEPALISCEPLPCKNNVGVVVVVIRIVVDIIGVVVDIIRVVAIIKVVVMIRVFVVMIRVVVVGLLLYH